MLGLVHIPEVFHQLRKDVSIGKNAPFRDDNLIWFPFAGLFYSFDPCKDRVDLEGKPPTSGLFVILFKDINVFAA